ncbi:MAG: TOBE domain-containing protein [Capsulimonadales bacterium]|nr:TOBE domain-containing protein [Capsulimonadales bacterium]
MPLFLTVHTLTPGELSEERIREIAILGQTDPIVRGYRSFHSPLEGRLVWLLEAPDKTAVLTWCAAVGLPVDGVTQLEIEGHRGSLRRYAITIPNRIAGTVVDIVTDPTMRLVRIDASGLSLYAAHSRTGAEAPDLRIGDVLLALFKAIHLHIERGTGMQLSFPNQIKGRVTNIVRGPAMTLVYLDTPVGELVSALIAPAVERLNVGVGDEVIAVFKATDVSLARE